MAYVAVFIPGAAEAQRHELGSSNVVGRSSEANIWVNEANVSRRHCTIERIGDQWVLIDLDSTNGTWLDAARVRRYALRDGETFYIGDTRVVFHADRRVEHRPANPNEALSIAKIFETPQTLADTALAPDSVNGRRRPLPQPVPNMAQQRRERPSPATRSLAFRRPPAMPLVRDQRRGGWVQVMLESICG